ncbi:MAG: aldo/keto reductase [Porphyromonadaceae bacterium]|nr:aldo/keto reductase [Porphyromonadaceae bacterium]
MKTKKLHGGVEIPVIGLGTYKIGNTDEETYRAVRTALDAGYRHIDTATLYENERPVGRAIRESGIAREEIFVTTKLWGSDILSNRIQEAFDGSLSKLGLDYVDLYLVHWPVKGKLGFTWHAMEQLFHSGKTRSIGVSNHLVHHIEELLRDASIMPTVNQMELHPCLTQKDVVAYCNRKGIVPVSWSPLGRNNIALLENEKLATIGEKYGKSPAQVILRWNVDKGFVTIPKSSDARRQKENLAIFDFQLTAEEISQIDALNRDHRTGFHPDKISF